MTFDHELTLISVTHGENDIGDPITTDIRTDVLCDVQSITRSEHYAAAAHGLEPVIVFVVNRYEYGGQKAVEFEGVQYKVERTFRANKSKTIANFDTLELVCAGLINGVM